MLALAGGAALALQGFWYLLLLAIPALPVFGWHLWLVSRRRERRQPGVEIVGAGVLALAAPAAYWVGRGAPEPLGWWLWGVGLAPGCQLDCLRVPAARTAPVAAAAAARRMPAPRPPGAAVHYLQPGLCAGF